ncbi:MAG: hypothetical protein K0S32_4567 [Bacteroidetes bacterium]|jgi:hypothetical protein|nr:hypothetical protein [Bacteroidota bacterium]
MKYFLAVFLFILCSCKNETNTGLVKDTITVKEELPKEDWEFVSEINFKVFHTDSVPWVNISSPDTSNLLGANETVIIADRYQLHIDYPLNVVITYNLWNKKNGLTRKDIIKLVSKKYHLIYNEENESLKSADKANQNFPNGMTKYGICCHDIADLDLGSVQVFRDKDRIIHLLLMVES